MLYTVIHLFYFFVPKITESPTKHFLADYMSTLTTFYKILIEKNYISMFRIKFDVYDDTTCI